MGSKDYIRPLSYALVRRQAQLAIDIDRNGVDGTLGRAALVLCDEVERLTAERDRAERERDEAREKVRYATAVLDDVGSSHARDHLRAWLESNR